jgi:hypothetical protein
MPSPYVSFNFRFTSADLNCPLREFLSDGTHCHFFVTV